MISPTVGRVVWFHAGAHATNLQSDQPLAAMITYVHSDELINLVVFGKGGDCHQRASVPLWQGESDAPAEHLTYAEWMPYQKGQAAKLEEAEAKVSDSAPVPSLPPSAPSQPIPPSPPEVDPYASAVD